MSLLHLLLLLLLLHVTSHGLPAPSPYNSAMCSQSYSCGGVVIKYPFYLSTATEYYDDTPYYCGYPGLGITCKDGETPILQLNKDNYTVKGIDYTINNITLADTDVLTSGNCPRVRHNVSFGPAWLHYASSNVDNLTFFFDCSLPPFSPPPPHVIANPINTSCSSFPSDAGLSFVFPTPDIPKDYDLTQMCRDIVVAPVLKDMLSNMKLPQLPSGYGSVLKQGFELAWNPSAGQCGYNQTGGFLGCLCSNGQPLPDYCNTPDKTSKTNPIKIGVSVAAGVLFLIAVIVSILYIRKRRQQKVTSSSKLLKHISSGGQPQSRDGDMESGSIHDLQTHLFTYEELEEATDGFKDTRELGDGGFGTVYKGNLRDGRVVAVKRLYNSYRRVEQFINEAAILSRLRHPNLVMFYGCTSSRSRELLLVYEFVPNGTVADHLHGPRASDRALTWPLRLNVAIESAAALAYLHAIEPPIVHRDVKTNNILLDADFHVKVADFGLSRLFPLDVTHVSTAPQGTPGYVDPEYHQCFQLTDKSDVYSFGVVLVELISSKPAVDITRHRNEINLAVMAVNKIQRCQLDQLVDLELGYNSDPSTKKMMTMVAELAFRCLQHNGEMRPPIKEVLEVLRGIRDGCGMKKDGEEGLLIAPFSPDTVHAKWESTTTTPNPSQ